MDKFFKFTERETSFRTETIAGITTFITMAYIIFVNPQFLSFFGDPKFADIALPIPATVTATCLASGLMCILMGLFTNYPVALASGMGLNAIVAYQLAATMGSFKPALGVIVIEGVIITILVLTRFREAVMYAIPMSMKHAIGVGIGMFIAFIGLQSGGMVKSDPNTIIALGELNTFPILVVVIAFILTAVLMTRKVPGAILIGIVFATLLSISANYIAGFTEEGLSRLGFATGIAVFPDRLFSIPDFSTFGYFDFSVFSKLGVLGAILTIFSIMLSDFFDTMGTVVGIGDKAGFMNEEGRIPKLRRILFIDSISAAFGGLSGASSVTSYIESAAGVSSGGRTGWMVVVVGILFLLAIFINPIVGIIPPQATAPALLIVGFMMMSLIAKISFDDLDTAIPAFLIIIMMPLTYSITDGIGVGFIVYTFIKVFKGRFREVHPLMYVVTVGFLIYFITPLLTKFI